MTGASPVGPTTVRAARRPRRVRLLKVAAVAVATALLALPAPSARATAVEWLDPTFGAGGTAVLVGEGAATAMSEPDMLSRVYVATSTFIPGEGMTWRLRRLTANGSVDPAFGAVLLAEVPPDEDFYYWVHTITPNADGTVTVVAQSAQGILLTQYTSTGQPDPGFGTNGTLTVLPSQHPWLSDVLPRAGGGYLVLGTIDEDIPADPFRLRHHYLVAVTGSGDLDEAFAPSAPTPGVLELLTTTGFYGSVHTVVARPGGGYVVSVNATGYVAEVWTEDYSLMGVSDAGEPDPTFAASEPTPGVLRIDFDAADLITDGTSVVAHGSETESGPTTFTDWEVLLRISSAGVPDPTFGAGGLVELPEPFSAYSGVTANGGAYYLGGSYTGLDWNTGPAITRVLPTGLVDSSFGTGGFALGPKGECGASIHRLFFQATQVLASGQSGCDSVWFVSRFSTSGVFDSGYGDAGLMAFDRIGGHRIFGDDIVMQADGRLVGLGSEVVDEVDSEANAVAFRLATAGPVALPGSFVSLPPSRILDTRNGNGVPAPGAVPGQGLVNLQVTGRGGVPASGVGAVVLNVTVTQPNWDGSVVAFPTGEPKPLASNLNFVAGQTIPNLVTVKVGAGGQVTLANNQIPGKTVHLVADVAGYYLSGAAVEPGTYTPLVPGRLLDTRNGTGAPAGPIPGQGSVNLQITGQGGVPASGVGAVVLNVTVTQPNWDGSVVAFPAGEPKPLASNLNFAANQTIPNLVTVKVGAGGQVTLANNQIPGKTLHLVADVAGYYLAGTATAKGTFVPLTPTRMLDTRSSTGDYTAPVGAFGEVRLRFSEEPLGDPPPAAVTDAVPNWWVGAVVMNVTVTQPTWDGSVVAYPTGTTPPLASNLNFVPNKTIPNLVIAKVGGGLDKSIQLRNNAIQGTVHLIVDISGYFNS